ncbi:uncharacterized protein [Rutidosis leptorrhynchoides]|uniref:uncharacterized protein n=1 Tax=Rutidosis leptorrhynchoides TaxID=125765 RepID=UPI003A999685
MKLTHICFADNLLVFCHGDVNSVKIIKRALTDFGDTSGLLPNMSKSTIFFGSVYLVTQGKIVQILPFEVGSLPMKYLGVPLLAKGLGLKIASVGASVLSAMQTYWASAQSECSKGKAKVAWKNVRVPKDQGSLGLRPLKDWNETLIVKQIWRLTTKQDSLWSKWINVINLKGISFWDINPSYNDSWGWRFLLRLRDKVKNHFGTDHINGSVKHVWVTNEGKKVPFSTHQERNNRLFRMEKRSDEDIYKAIRIFVQYKLLTFRVKHSIAIKKVARVWDLKLIDGRFYL